MAEVSSILLYVSFILYLIATLFFGASIRQKKGIQKQNAVSRTSVAGKIGFIITSIGFVLQLGYFVTRWIAGGYPPISNMFEFITFFSIMLVGAFMILYYLYRIPALGVFALPIVVILIGYASMFSRNITPLSPTLQSNWLIVHVMTTAAGQAILAISFVAGLIYLVKNVQQMSRAKAFWVEAIMFVLIIFVGFIAASTTFSIANYEMDLMYVNKEGEETQVTYHLPVIFGPHEYTVISEGGMEPLIELPAWVNAKQLNTLTWSFLTGAVIYLVIRLLARRRIADLLQPVLQKMNNDILDEVSYRSVLIGFPVFTLGALIFGMIYAHFAWGRFWAWDPKEVWALITWFFYSAFLHLRLSRGWHGEKSAWLAVIGFAIIMFNLIFVNLVIAGLHSYAV